MSCRKLVRKSRSHVANLLRLLDLPDLVRSVADDRRYQDGPCSRRRDRAGPGGAGQGNRRQGPVAVRQAEIVRSKRTAAGAGRDIGRASARNAAKTVDADLAALERQLGDILGFKVKVTHRARRVGHAALFSLEQLDMICQRLSAVSRSNSAPTAASRNCQQFLAERLPLRSGTKHQGSFELPSAVGDLARRAASHWDSIRPRIALSFQNKPYPMTS